MTNKTKTFLVLGGTGYLGSKVIHSLRKRGYRVVCTKRKNSSTERLKDIIEEILWIPASKESIDDLFKNDAIECVLNLACNYGRQANSYEDVIESNIAFPLCVLNRAVESGTNQFLTIGTGLPRDLNIYAFSKDIFSRFGEFYANKGRINFVTMKMEMFYGADEPADRFIPKIIRQMLDGEEVNTTQGKQKRDIVAVSDIVDAIFLAIDADIEGYVEIPVGTGVSPSVEEIVDYIWDVTGRKSIINKGGVLARENEPDCIADTSILESLGTWNPIDWKTGIREMINEIRGE